MSHETHNCRSNGNESEGYDHDCIATQQGSKTMKAESQLQYVANVTVTHPLVTKWLTL